MPAVEIDEVELLRLRKQDQTIHALMAHPTAKKKVFEAFKARDPDAKIPELEIEEAAKAPVVELQKTVETLQKQLEDDKAERQRNATLSQLEGTIAREKAALRRQGWTDEGLSALDKVMEEKGITDVTVAAAYYEKVNPPPEPINSRSGIGGWDFTSQIQDSELDLKALIETKGNNEALADKMAREALKDIRGASRR